jgi:hypothetical protein
LRFALGAERKRGSLSVKVKIRARNFARDMRRGSARDHQARHAHACGNESVAVIRAFCAAVRPLKRLRRPLPQIFFHATISALSGASRLLKAILIHVASNACVQNYRIKRHHRNPHSMGTFAPRRIFGRKSRHRESFWKGVSVSIAPSARRHGVKRNLYTKLSGKDVFFALLV